MPITEAQLADKLEEALDFEADKDVNPEDARRRLAEKIAAAIFDAMIGRLTQVTGTSATGGAVTGTGTIQE